MKVYERFWDRIAARYARTPVADAAAYEEKLRRTRELLTPQSVVFEFGCGTGTTAVHHAPFVARILAIDVSRKMIEIAGEKASAARAGNVQFEVGSIDDYAETAEEFDMVMAHSILHLVRDRDAAIRKAFAMLKPGGWFVSSTICMGDHFSLRVIARVVSALSWLGVLPWINGASRQQLLDSMRSAGFSVEQQWQPNEKAALFVIARKPG